MENSEHHCEFSFFTEREIWITDGFVEVIHQMDIELEVLVLSSDFFIS